MLVTSFKKTLLPWFQFSFKYADSVEVVDASMMLNEEAYGQLSTLMTTFLVNHDEVPSFQEEEGERRRKRKRTKRRRRKTRLHKNDNEPGDRDYYVCLSLLVLLST